MQLHLKDFRWEIFNQSMICTGQVLGGNRVFEGCFKGGDLEKDISRGDLEKDAID